MAQLVKTGMTTPGILVVNGFATEAVRDKYLAIPLPANWKRVVFTANRGCNAPLNWVFKNYKHEPFYGAIDDDEWIETEGWDLKLIEAAGRWKIANANDGVNSQTRIQSFVCIGGDLVRCTGWHTLPGLFHWYGETVWEILDARCHLRVWCPEIKAEHRHWMNKKAEVDETYRSQEAKRNKDGWRYQQWVDTELFKTASKIIRDRENGRSV